VKSERDKFSRMAVVSAKFESGQVFLSGISSIEVGRYLGNQDSLAAIESVLRSAGIEFLEENGVRFRELEATKAAGSL